MSDLFHEDVPTEYVERVFGVMSEAGQHQFQVLTKRADRLLKFTARRTGPGERLARASASRTRLPRRIDYLRQIKAAVRFLSIEPLLGPVERLTFAASTGSSSAAKAGTTRAPWPPSGCAEIREQCLRRAGPVLLQAVGRPVEAPDRARVGWSDVGRDADGKIRNSKRATG